LLKNIRLKIFNLAFQFSELSKPNKV
jgi:hypothetical protein